MRQVVKRSGKAVEAIRTVVVWVSLLALLASVMGVFATSRPAEAADFSEFAEFKLTASDGANDDNFGFSVAIDGDTLVVGAPFDDVWSNASQGSAYVFVRSGTAWIQQKLLTANDGAAGDMFGYSVAISGDTVVVGAIGVTVGSNLSQGAAYVFVRSGTSWSQQAKLMDNAGFTGDLFGLSVAIDGETVVVGTLTDQGGNTDVGSACVFNRSGTSWSPPTRLIADLGGAAFDDFGLSVAISGDTVVVGAPGENISSYPDIGSVYVFKRSFATWIQEDNLVGTWSTANDNFGQSVAVSGDTVIVGVRWDDVYDNSNQGSAYVFTRSGTSWSERQLLTASDGGIDDWFGQSVAIDGETVVVGAYHDDVGGNTAQGSAYVFVRSDIWSAMASGTTNLLYGVWGSSSSNVFAVGDVGTIRHYNGSEWSPMTSGTGVLLQDVWGSSSSDVFAVGNGGTIRHYNGSEWSPMTSGTTNHLRGVWGSSSSNVFAVGDGGTILRYNGSAWSPMTSGTTSQLYSVWGSSSSDVFAVGMTGTILHYNGSAWSAMTSGTTNLLYGVWGSSSSDVFAVGMTGTILHYNGSAWSAMTSGTTASLYGGIWGSSSSNVLAVGDGGTILRYNGSAWSAMNSGTTNHLRGVWGSSSSNVFAVGDAGTIQHYPEPTWSEQQKLTASDGAPGDNFGGSVAISGETVIAGAPEHDVGVNARQGSAYVYWPLETGGATNVAATVTLESLSITITIPEGYPTAVDYGLMVPDSESVPVSYTPGTYQYLRVQNSGNVAEDLYIKGADATCGAGKWTLWDTPGANQYSHLYGLGPTPVSYSTLSTLASILGTNVAVDGTVDFNLKIRTPTSSSVYGLYSTTVTVLAVAH